MIRKYVLPILAVIGIAITVFMVIKGNETPPASKPALQSARAPYTSYIFGPGIVEASTENIAIGTPVSGIVTAVYVKWADRVKTGDPLFTVDSSDLQAQLPPALAKVKEAEANLAKIKNRLRVGQNMTPGVSISVEDLDNRRLDVGIAEAALASAEAQVAQIKTEIERRTVRARLPGRILQMKTRLGEYAQSGSPSTLMLLGNDDRLHIRVDVDENDAWRFQPCAAATASVRGNPELKTVVKFEHTDPDVVPKVSLTSDSSTQRIDTRVLQVIYSFERGLLPVYVGQQMDVFIEVPAANDKTSHDQNASGKCDDARQSTAPTKKRGKS